MKIPFLLCVALFCFPVLAGQDAQDRGGIVWQSPARKPAPKPGPKPGPRKATNAPQPTAQPRPLGFGFTVFLRDSQGNPVRVDHTTTTFENEARVRFFFESATDGYLYVFTVGDDGNARMFYPDPRVKEGDNRVRAFVPYELPSSSSPVPWIRLFGSPGTERFVAVLAREPIAGLPIGDELRIFCSESQGKCVVRPDAKTWNAILLTQPEFEKARDFGAGISQAESAAADREVELTGDAPPPAFKQIDSTGTRNMLVGSINLKHR